MKRLAAVCTVIVLTTPLAGCGLGPRNFRKITHPAPLVRARAVSLGDSRPDAVVIPALVGRMNDPDVVVRMAANEELKRRTGQDFGFQAWASSPERANAVALAGLAGRRADCAWTNARSTEKKLAPAVASRTHWRPGRRTLAMTTSATAIASAPASASGVPFWLSPIAWLGRSVIGVLSYLGGVTALFVSAWTSLLRFPRSAERPLFWPVLKEELWWLLLFGIPLVGLVHVAMGSFLSMQAYFGSTFLDGTGAVVGVGLLRNLATLMTGLTMSGLLACRFIPLRLGLAPARSPDDPDAADEPGQDVPPARLAAPRIIAAGLASMLLALWGFVVGTAVGWQAAGTLMGLSSTMYFQMFYLMIWFRDVVGMIVKGLLFGIFPATICCFESLRAARRMAAGTGSEADHTAVAALTAPVVRGACLSMVSILLLNMTWFLLVYHAVPVYGPSLLQPPTP